MYTLNAMALSSWSKVMLASKNGVVITWECSIFWFINILPPAIITVSRVGGSEQTENRIWNWTGTAPMAEVHARVVQSEAVHWRPGLAGEAASCSRAEQNSFCTVNCWDCTTTVTIERKSGIQGIPIAIYRSCFNGIWYTEWGAHCQVLLSMYTLRTAVFALFPELISKPVLIIIMLQILAYLHYTWWWLQGWRLQDTSLLLCLLVTATLRSSR